MRELPKGWANVRLGDVLPLRYGKGLTKSLRTDGDFPVYGSSGIVGCHNSALTSKPTLIIGRKGSVGAVHLSMVPCWPIDTTYFVEENHNICLPFFKYLIESLDLARLDRSTAVPGLTLTDYEKIEVGIPPLPEQRRIVAEIEKQFTRLDAAMTQINSSRQKVKLLISSMLESTFAQDWPTTPLRHLAHIKGGITKDTSRRDLAQCSPVPYLRVANVQRGFLDLAHVKEIMATPDEVAELQLKLGDILFTEGGDRDKLGRGWIWQGEMEVCIHQNHVFRARVNGSVLPKWVSYYANGVGQRYFFKEGKQTTNLASINITKLGSLPIPTLPIEEQQKIIDQLEANLTEAQQLEAELTKASLHTARLRQAILAKAFSGQLAPQDPGDEPASVMLERLRRQRSHPATKRTPRHSSVRQIKLS